VKGHCTAFDTLVGRVHEIGRFDIHEGLQSLDWFETHQSQAYVVATKKEIVRGAKSRRGEGHTVPGGPNSLMVFISSLDKYTLTSEYG